jgi:hypothetical protein
LELLVAQSFAPACPEIRRALPLQRKLKKDAKFCGFSVSQGSFENNALLAFARDGTHLRFRRKFADSEPITCTKIAKRAIFLKGRKLANFGAFWSRAGTLWTVFGRTQTSSFAPPPRII